MLLGERADRKDQPQRELLKPPPPPRPPPAGLRKPCSNPRLPTAGALRWDRPSVTPRETRPVCMAGARPTKERPASVRTPGFPDIRPPPRVNDRPPSPRGNAGARTPWLTDREGGVPRVLLRLAGARTAAPPSRLAEPEGAAKPWRSPAVRVPRLVAATDVLPPRPSQATGAPPL